MSNPWTAIGERIVEALGVEPGSLVQVREWTNRGDIVPEVLLAIERRGATPLLEPLAPAYLQRLLSLTDPAILATWDRHRCAWMEAIDRVLVLQGEEPELGDVSPTALEAWQEATARIDAIEERRQIPYLLVAIPTEVRARELKMTLAELDAALLPALSASAAELAAEVDALRAAVGNARTLTIQSGVGHRLTLDISGRHWLRDVGTLQLAGVPEGVQPVHNLPAGSLYTTVVESATTGSIRIPELASARDVVLRFVDGRIVAIEADQGGEQLTAMFDRHSGEPRRVSHLGIGVNRHVASPVGWPLVDEHRRGTLFLAFGENRYLGGANTSSLNLDVVIPNAKLLADDCIIVTEGNLSLTPDD